MAFFRPNDPFVTNTPCFLGSKFEYSFTNPHHSESAIQLQWAVHLQCPIEEDARGIRIVIVSKKDAVGSIQGAVSKERMQLGHLQRGCHWAVCKEDADRHRTMVASHTAVPMGTAKWLERPNHTPGTLPLGKGQGLLMSPTQGQAILLGATPYQPFRSPQGDSCMAGYHCLMPTAFLPLQYNT